MIFATLFFTAAYLLLYARARQYPTFADAGGYVNIAVNFIQNGFNAPYGDVRTYLYPTFLMLIGSIAGGDFHSIVAAAPIIQAAVYLLSALWLFAELRKFNASLAVAIFVGLVANVININFLADTLTEGLTISIAIALLAISLRLSASVSLRIVLLWFAIGSILACAAVMIRPANIVLLCAWATAGWVRCGFQTSLRGKAGLGLAFGGQLALASIAIFAPQVVYNLNNYSKFSIFPAYELGAKQAGWGIEILKYETFVTYTADRWYAVGVRYLNPFYDRVGLPDGALHWYLQHPVEALGTFVSRLAASFNIEDIFVYLVRLDPWYSRPMSFFVWTLVLMGAHWAACKMYPMLRSYLSGARTNSAVAISFVSVAVIATCVLNLITAFENRFSLIPLTVLLCCGVAKIMCVGWRVKLHYAGLVVALALSATWASYYHRAKYFYIEPKDRWILPCTSTSCLSEKNMPPK